MAEEQDPESVPPRMTGHLPNLVSMCDPDLLELVWENGQIRIRGSSSKISTASLPCSGYFSQSSKARIQREGETTTANRSKDGVADSMLNDPLSGLTKLDHYDKNKINSYPNSTLRNSLQTCPELLSELYEDGFNVVLELEQKCYSKQLIDSNIGATRPTSSPCLAGAEDLEGNAESTPRSINPFDMMLVKPTKGSKNISTEKEGNFMAINMKPILPNSGTQKDSLPDEHSEAVGYKDAPQNTRFAKKVHGPSSSLAPNTAINGDPGTRKSVEQMLASSSVCSREASNCPIYTLKRRYEDTDLGDNAMEEPEGTTKAAPAEGSKGAKGNRKVEVHNLSERRRRDKINKKMRALKELIPNCNKVDKASMLDEAIEYLKTLQLQVQMMSMGTGVFMPPMMLPSAMQHMNAQHLAGFSPMAVGMGMRMQMGLGCSPAQFPISLMSGAAALPGIMEARLNMLGFPGQDLLMSMSGSPFVSLAGKLSSPSVQGPGVSEAAAAQVELPAAAVPLSTSKDPNSTH